MSTLGVWSHYPYTDINTHRLSSVQSRCRYQEKLPSRRRGKQLPGISVHWPEQYFPSTNLRCLHFRVKSVSDCFKVTQLAHGPHPWFLVTILKYYKAAKFLFATVKCCSSYHENVISILYYSIDHIWIEHYLTHFNTVFKILKILIKWAQRQIMNLKNNVWNGSNLSLSSLAWEKVLKEKMLNSLRS